MNDRSLYITRWAYVIVIYALVLLSAIHSMLTDGNDGASMGFSLATTFGVVLCCITDARLRGRSILHIVQFLMLIAWPISLMIYLLWSRRWWGLLWCIGAFVSYLTMSFLGWLIVVIVVYGGP